MDDNEIIELFNARSETAIEATALKYGKYILYIAGSILGSSSDAEECANDTYNTVWGLIPPNCPDKLQSFVGKVARNLALKRYEQLSAAKRGGDYTAAALDELSECTSGSCGDMADSLALRDALHCFLSALPDKKRRVFLRRYWYMSSVSEIAADFAMSESNVKVTLMRLRKELKKSLQKAGIEYDK